MQRFFIPLTALCVFFFACKQDPKNVAPGNPSNTSANAPASPQMLGGHWIAMDFCSRANQYGSVLAAINNAHVPYCYSFEVNPSQPDSVLCSNGMETFKLAVKYLADTLVMLNARPGKNIFLVYDSKDDQDITMFDGSTGSMQMDRFVKSKANARDGYMAFQVALNHNLFGGTLTQIGKAASGQITFTPGGFILGMKEYDRYVVCTAGDCFVGDDKTDVITLSNHKNKGSEKMFCFRYNAYNDTLTFYNLVNKRPQEKGGYAVGAPAYRFYRKEQ